MLLLYFSATGNSKYIAESLCAGTDSQCHSIEEYIDFEGSIKAADTVGFCYPVYGSCVPRIIREFAAKYLHLLNNKKLVILCTQLMFSGDGARAFTDLLPREIKQNVIYAEHFNMPNNLCNVKIFRVTNEAENKKKLFKAEKKLQTVCNDLKIGKIKKRGFNVFSRFLGSFQSAFFPAIEKKYQNDVQTDSDCNACGLCVKLCPMNNLTLINQKISQKGNCTLCYRCVNICPQKAITTMVHAKVKKQYKGIR